MRSATHERFHRDTKYAFLTAMDKTTPEPLTHTWLDDGHALIAGSLFIALGLTMFAHAGLLTGGVAGVAFLVSYTYGLSLALCFF